ncbi:MAG TPA: hypothetical protein VHP32_06320 [Ignavibacteria bacterium]|nr:hypothetical protein [Ignavibacteria bacterium]
MATQCAFSQTERLPIPGIFNTGVNGNNQLLADGEVDLHYKLVSSDDSQYPGPDAFIPASDIWPIGQWIPNGPESKWIAPRFDADKFNASGYYVYRLTFDLTSFHYNTAEIGGIWSTDNNGMDILINGTSTGFQTPFESFYGISPFFINTGFQPGLNTIDFIVYNGHAPTGLRVEIKGTAVPLNVAFNNQK